MPEITIYFLGVLCFTVFKINGQSPDPTFCNINQIPVRPNPLDFPKIDYGKYEARVEKSTNDSKGIVTTEETHEFFDGDDNIGAAKAHFDGVTLYTYSYYNIDELLMVGEDNQCTVRKLSEWYSVSPFFVVNTSDGEKILSPLQYLLNSATFGPVVSTNDSIIRGIPVNQWQTCLFSTNKMATLKVTIAFSDPTKWNPAGSTPPAVSAVPVSIRIESKTTTGDFSEETFSITNFRTFIVEGEERFYTPSGVYCEGRKNTVPLPNLPDKFEFHAEIVTPFFMDLVGTIEAIRESYDYKEKLYRQDRSVSNSRETEIHDFSTGLNYKLKQNSGNCTIQKLDLVGPDVVIDDNGKIVIRNPLQFFDFDSNNYHFTGRRVINGVYANVWIAKKKLSEDTYATFEWYFLNEKWIDVDLIGKNASLPVYAKVSAFTTNSQPRYFWYTFSDFQSESEILLNNDISICYDSFEKRRFKFTISNENVQTILNYASLFKVATIKKLHKSAKVTVLRINQLEFVTSQDSVQVLFTIVQKSSFYGIIPDEDVSLDDAIENLSNAFKSSFDITFKIDDNEFVSVYADQNSFEEILPNKQLCIITKDTIGIPLPDLPNQFQTIIEHNYRSFDFNNNYTEEYEEFYDFVNDRAAIHKRSNLKLIQQYFLYTTNEMITVIDNECAVTPLNLSTNNPFGYVTVNDTYQINSPSFVLKFGNSNVSTEYMGSDIARGINVQKWQSCVYFDIIETTVKLTWTFSDPDVWKSPIVFTNSSAQFPIEMSIEALTDQGQTWSEKIEYSFYRPYIAANPEVFETPKGVYCEGRKPTKNLPKVPNKFSYRIEITLVDLNKTTSQAEWYDFDNNIARIDYQPLSTQDIETFGNNLVSEIHDFNQGVRYIINKNKEQCINITTLDSGSFDSISANKSEYIRIRTALELFHFDKTDYQYHGSRKIRNIDCDVWIAKRNDWPSGYDFTSTFEWYFMSEKWAAINSGQTQINVPVQLVITQYIPFGQLTLTTSTIYNYYDFITGDVHLTESFGVNSCFDGSDSKRLQVTFEGINLSILADKNTFKIEFLKKLIEITYLLRTRIDQITLDFDQYKTYVSFKLLEKSPVTGNVINPVQQISLDDAQSLLRQKIDNGEFIIVHQNITYTAIKNSLIDFTTFDFNVTISNGKASDPFTNSNVVIVIVFSVIGAIVFTLLVQIIIFKIKTRRNGKFTGPLTMSGLLNTNYEITE